jgi:hypothetical protein
VGCVVGRRRMATIAACSRMDMKDMAPV